MVETLTPEEQRRELELVFSWLPQDAIDLYIGGYVEYGNTDAAWSSVREDSRYEQWFPGNMTTDGRPRMPEAQYAYVTASYDKVIASVGLNPAVFRPRYGELIAGDVSPQELESDRVAPMYERIMERAPEIQRYYADNFGIDMTSQALLASAIDPDLGTRILSHQISMSEVAGEAATRGYNLSTRFTNMLVDQGMDWQKAHELFGTADRMLPVLQTLSARHNDPDDEFDIEEFVSGYEGIEPGQTRRIQQVLAQEQSMWQEGSLNYTRDRETGGVKGLAT